jgi:hypothetical protein
MEIRVNVLGKVAYKENGSREDAEKAELYPFGEGVYAVMDGENFVALRVVSGKKHSDEKGDYYAFVDNYWGNGKISNSAMLNITQTMVTEIRKYLITNIVTPKKGNV